MPYAPARPCRGQTGGCRATTKARDGWCDSCRAKSRQQLDAMPHRREAHAFYKSPAWRRLRKQVLGEEPICRECKDAYSEIADHIKSRRQRPDLALVRENLRGLCKPCHDKRSGRQAREGQRRSA